MTSTRAAEALDPVTYEVGRRVAQLMWERKITQRAAAAAMGMAQTSISGKLSGRVGITLHELLRFAQLLDVDAAALLPRLDSNQQPSGYPSSQVSGMVGEPYAVLAVVVDLAAYRADRGSAA